jgi:hypothetical protein
MVIRATTSAGTLYVTSARILFVPSRMNLPTRILRERHVWPLADIETVDVAAPDYSLGYAGGMHKRLRLSLRSGDTVLFRIAVRELDQVAGELQALIALVPQLECASG